MKERIAIVGTGMAGMACGHLLHDTYDLTFYEKNDYVGGHTNTLLVDEDGQAIPIDTGFMVFNHATYPNLTRLFAELDVPTRPTSMSFSVQHIPSGLEFSGSGLNGLFAQRRNFLNPSYLRLLIHIDAFNKQCTEVLASDIYTDYSIREYVMEKRWTTDLLDKYLLPMSSAVWSTPPEQMADFPVVMLVRFFHNHGFLGLHTQHPWYTVAGGSRSYRDKIIEPFRDRIYVSRAAAQIVRRSEQAGVIDAAGLIEWYDRVILACHADEALDLLQSPTADEIRYLRPFEYARNRITLHTDSRVMPKARRAWSSWNYRMNKDQEGILQASTIYYMNSLQQVSDKKDYFISINAYDRIAESTIIREMTYDHPIFTLETQRLQPKLPSLNAGGPVFFCGSYFRYGFHEDALLSALDLCRRWTRKAVAA